MGFKRAFKSFKNLLSRLIGRIDELIQQAREIIGEAKMVTIYSFTTGEGERVAVPLGWAAKAATFAADAKVIGGIPAPDLDPDNFVSQRDIDKINVTINRIASAIKKLLLADRLIPKIDQLARLIKRIVRILRLAIKVAGLVGFLGGPALAKKIADIVATVKKLLDWLDDATSLILRITELFNLLIQALTTDLNELKGLYGFPEDDSEIDYETEDSYYLNGGFDRDLAGLTEDITKIEFEIEVLNLRRAPQTKADCHKFVEGLACIDNLNTIIGHLDFVQENAKSADGEDLISEYEHIVGDEVGQSMSVLAGIRSRLEFEKNRKGHIVRLGGGRGVKSSTGVLHIPSTIETKSTSPDEGNVDVDWKSYQDTAEELVAKRGGVIDSDSPENAQREHDAEKSESVEEIRKDLSVYAPSGDASPNDPHPIDSADIQSRLEKNE